MNSEQLATVEPEVFGLLHWLETHGAVVAATPQKSASFSRGAATIVDLFEKPVAAQKARQESSGQ